MDGRGRGELDGLFPKVQAQVGEPRGYPQQDLVRIRIRMRSRKRSVIGSPVRRASQ